MADAQRSLADLPPVGLAEWEAKRRQAQPAILEVQRDYDKAQRAERLAAFLQSDVWRLDILPILERMHDEADQAITPDTPADKLLGWTYFRRALTEFVNLLGGHIQLGQGAIRRLAERKFNGRIPGVTPPRR